MAKALNLAPKRITRFGSLVIAAAAVLATTSSCARRPGSVRPDSAGWLKLEEHHGYLVAPVEVQGRPMRMLLDTGASHLVLTPAACKRISCTTFETKEETTSSGKAVTATHAKLTSVSFAGKTTADLDVAIIDMSMIPDFALGGPIDGVIGGSLLAASRFTIDFARHRFRWENDSSEPDSPTNAVEAPLVVENNLPFIDVAVAGGPRGGFLIDTGGGKPCKLNREKFPLLLATGVIRDASEETSTDASGQPRKTTKGRVSSLSIAPALERKDLRVVYEAMKYDGVLGTGFFDGAEVTFDYQGHELRWRK